MDREFGVQLPIVSAGGWHQQLLARIESKDQAVLSDRQGSFVLGCCQYRFVWTEGTPTFSSWLAFSHQIGNFGAYPIFVSDKLTPTETALHCDISSHQGLRRKYPPNVSCPFLEEVAHNTNPQQNMMMWCNWRGSQFVCESHLYFEDRQLDMTMGFGQFLSHILHSKVLRDMKGGTGFLILLREMALFKW